MLTLDNTKFVMDDIRDWKKYVKLPDLDAMDWDSMSKRIIETLNPNKVRAFMGCACTTGALFMPLVNMMGFENGLCALLEDPETVKEMFEHVCSYTEKMIDYGIQYFDPEVVILEDDLCCANGPMMSMECYQTLFKPYYKRLIDRIHSHGRFVEFHMCGKGEQIVEDLAEMGIDSWQMAQPLNDLVSLRKKFGRKPVFNGAWASDGPGGVPGASEEAVRASVREAMDRYGKDGGLVFFDGDAVGTSEDMKKKMEWLADEARRYGKAFYKN